VKKTGDIGTMTEVDKPVTLKPHDARRVGVMAGTDPRTVLAYLAGRPMRSTTAARVREALRALGITDRSEANSSKVDVQS